MVNNPITVLFSGKKLSKNFKIEITFGYYKKKSARWSQYYSIYSSTLLYKQI